MEHRGVPPGAQRRHQDDVPYPVGLIELDDGPRMYGTLIGEPGSFEQDRPVRAVFVPVTAAVTLTHWEQAWR
ncbi:OB-fold domain-containing protein [Amycolatopsis sp. NBC_01480]